MPSGRAPRWQIKNPNGDGRNYLVTDEAVTLLAEADQALAGNHAETLGVFVREERDPFTRALITSQRCRVARQDDGSYRVTVTDQVGPGAEDRQAERRMRQLRRVEVLARQAEPSLEDLEADPEVMAEGDKILGSEGRAARGIPFGPRKERGE